MTKKQFIIFSAVLLILFNLTFISATITTTLNSPADNSYFYSKTTSFNYSTNTTSDGLVNASLFTNESGVWSSYNYTNLTTGAIPYSNETHGVAISTLQFLGTTKVGASIGVKGTAIKLRIIQKDSNTDATKAYLCTTSSCSTILSTVNFNGNLADFGGYELSADTKYWIMVDDNGASYNAYRTANGAITLPLSETYFYWNSSWDGSSERTNIEMVITTIEVGDPYPISEYQTNIVRGINNSIIWNVKVCDSTGTCSFSDTNYTLIKGEPFVNSNTFNSSTYETARESFILNVSANSSLTAVTLDYNGTDYSMTNSGGLWSKTIDIPEGVSNRTLRYKFTYGGDTIYSDYFYQNVQQTVFTLCNATYTDDFLNISFKDEADLSYINASIPTSSFTYYLGSGTVNKTYTYSNATENYYYDFCASPTDRTMNVLPYAQYKNGVDYPQRIWQPTVQEYTSTVTNKILYLLSSLDGIYVTFQVVNSAEQVISGVDVTATRTIDSEDVIVAQGTTGASGTVTFWLNPDFSHEFTFSKTGYDTYTYSDTPTQTSYTVTLTSGTTTSEDYLRGIDFSILPTNSSLVNDTIYTFGFNLTSSYWDVDEYGFNLRLTNGTIIIGDSTGTEGTQLTKNYNTTNQSQIYLDYYWVVDGNYTNGTRVWVVYNTEYASWSIKTFFTDLRAYMDSGLFGIDDFGRYLLIFLILFISAGILGYKYGLSNPLFVSGVIFFVIFFFDVGVGLIPDIRILNGTVIPNLLTFASGLIFVVSIIKEVYR